jgi:hypothetical protein
VLKYRVVFVQCLALREEAYYTSLSKLYKKEILHIGGCLSGTWISRTIGLFRSKNKWHYPLSNTLTVGSELFSTSYLIFVM